MCGITAQKPAPVRGRHEILNNLQIGFRAFDQTVQAALAVCPVQGSMQIFHTEQRRRIDGITAENPVDQFAAFGQLKNLWQRLGRCIALQPTDRTRRQDNHTMSRFPAQ